MPVTLDWKRVLQERSKWEWYSQDQCASYPVGISWHGMDSSHWCSDCCMLLFKCIWNRSQPYCDGLLYLFEMLIFYYISTSSTDLERGDETSVLGQICNPWRSGQVSTRVFHLVHSWAFIFFWEVAKILLLWYFFPSDLDCFVYSSDGSYDPWVSLTCCRKWITCIFTWFSSEGGSYTTACSS